jgi:putative ABC transport system permease protein
LRSNFGNNAFYTYFTVGQGFEPTKMEARFPKFLDDVFPPPPPGSTNSRPPHEFTRLHLQRLGDIHLQSQHDDEIEPGGDLARVRMFGFIALVILLIAGVNYVNLATAFSLRRAREIGVRKSNGARRGQIIGQFLSESLLLSAGAAGLGLGLTALAIPLVRKKLDIDLTPDPATLGWMLAAFAGISLLSGLLAGLYPAFFMSGFRPVAVLKSGNATTKSNVSLRKALVVFQFSISIALLVGTFVISRQLNFMQNKELGLDKDRVVTLLQNNKLRPQWNAFRAELLRSPYVKDVAQSSRFPADRLLDYLNGTSVQIGDTMSPLTVTLKMLNVDMDFVNTYQIPLAAGRSFSRDFPTDTTQGP